MSMNQAPIETLFKRLCEKERIIMVENLREERGTRGIHPMLRELAERSEWKNPVHHNKIH